jgi:hypothetical protein
MEKINFVVKTLIDNICLSLLLNIKILLTLLAVFQQHFLTDEVAEKYLEGSDEPEFHLQISYHHKQQCFVMQHIFHSLK